jgi:elongation factor G
MYLPDPLSKENKGFLLDQENKTETEVGTYYYSVFLPEDKQPFVGYAFKLEENKFG